MCLSFDTSPLYIFPKLNQDYIDKDTILGCQSQVFCRLFTCTGE